MLNIIIIILLIHSLISFKLKPSLSVLYCGLFGFIGDSPKKFNWDKFNILGAMNDIRGGDSCGRMVNNNLEYGNDKLSKYKDYVLAYNNPPMNSLSAFGHTRKASSGGSRAEYTQPIAIWSDDEIFAKKYETAPRKWKKWADGMLEKYETFLAYSIAHNGTIHNYEEIASEYSIDHKGLNDTTVLAHILFLHGYEVLEKYQGSAALVIYDRFYEDALFLYHGKSKRYEATKEADEERPLNIWQRDNNTIYFSSERFPLQFIGGKGDEVFNLKYNTVFRVVGNIFITERKIDRSKAFQVKPWKNSNNNINYNYKRSNYEKHHFNGYGYDNDDESTYYDSIKNKGKKSKISTVPVMNIMRQKTSYDNHKAFKNLVDINFENEVFGYDSNIFTRIVYHQGFYWKCRSKNDLELLTGAYNVNLIGVIDTKFPSDHPEYYFYKGILLKNKEGFNVVTGGLAVKQVSFSKQYTNASTFSAKMCSYSKYPIHTLNPVDAKYQDIRDSSQSFYTGSYSPIFSKRTYHVERGDLMGITLRTHFNKEEVSENFQVANEVQKSFFHENWNLCGSCKTFDCDNCIVLSKDAKFLPILDKKIEIEGKSFDDLIKKNRANYYGEYDFCKGCKQRGCSTCIVLNLKGTTLPSYKKNNEETSLDDALDKSIALDTDTEMDLMGDLANEGTPLVGSETDIGNNTITKKAIEEALDKLEDSLEIANDDLEVIGEEVTTPLQETLSEFRTKLYSLKTGI